MDSLVRLGRLKVLSAAVLVALGGYTHAGGVPIVTANVVRMADGRDQVNMSVIDPDAHGTPYGPSNFSIYIKAIGRNDPSHQMSNYDGLTHTAANTTSPNPAYFLSADQLIFAYSKCVGSPGNWSGCVKASPGLFGPAVDTYDVYVYAQNGVGKSTDIHVGTYTVSYSPKMQSVADFPHLVNIASYPSNGMLTSTFHFYGHDFEPSTIALAQLVNENRGGTWGWYPGPWTFSVPAAGVNSATISWAVNRDKYGANVNNFIRKYELASAWGAEAPQNTWMLEGGKFADMPGVSDEILFDLLAPELRGNLFDPLTGKYSVIGYDSTDGVSGRSEWGMSSVGLELKHKAKGTQSTLSTTSLSAVASGMKGVLDLANLEDGYYTADAVLVDKFGNAAKLPVESNLEVANHVVTLTKGGSPFSAGSVTGLSQLQLNLSEVADSQTLNVTLKGGPENVNLPITVTPSGQGYALTHPLIVPSGATNDYTLIATLKTKNGISRSYSFPLKYEPVTIGVDPALGVTSVVVPAMSTPVATKFGTSSFTTDSFGLSGSADVVVRWTGTTSIVVGGQTLAPGDIVSFNGYNFGANGGKFSASIAAAHDDEIASGKLLVMTNVGSAPIMSATVTGLVKPSVVLSAAQGMPASPFYVLPGAGQTAFYVMASGTAGGGKMHVVVADENAKNVADGVVVSGGALAVQVNGSGLYSTHSMNVNASYDLFPGFFQEETTSYTVLGALPSVIANPLTGTSLGSIEVTGKIGVKGSSPLVFDQSVTGRVRTGAIVKGNGGKIVKTVDMGEASTVDLSSDLGVFSANTYTVTIEAELLTSSGAVTGIKTYSQPVSLSVLPGVGLDSLITEGKAVVPVGSNPMHNASGLWPLSSAVMTDVKATPIVDTSDIDVIATYTGGQITIGGIPVVSGSKVTIKGYDFGANMSRITLPLTASGESAGRIKFIPANPSIPAFEAEFIAVDIVKAVKASSSAVSAAARVQPYKVSLNAGAPLCGNVLIIDGAKSGVPGSGCAIRFDNIPTGLTLDASNKSTPISGIFNGSGQYDIAYTLGWNEQGIFIPLTASNNLSTTVVDPALPQLYFNPAAKAEIGPDTYIVRGGSSVGAVVAHSDIAGAKLIVEASASGHNAAASGVSVTPADASVGLVMSKTDVFAQETITLTAYYADAPDLKVSKTIQVGVLGNSPSIILNKSIPVANKNSNVILPLYYGFGGSPEQFQFDPKLMGLHRLALVVTDQKRSVVANIANIMPDGSQLNIPLGDLPSGNYSIAITDDQLANDSSVLTSSNVTIGVNIVDGRPIQAKVISALSAVGRVPMSLLGNLKLDSGFSATVLGDTTWLVSYDGNSYEPVGRDVIADKFSFAAKMATPGKVWVKARMTNLISGNVSETAPLLFTGVKSPSLLVDFPTEAIKGKPIALKARETGGQIVDYVWQIADGKIQTTLTGDNVSYTPQSIGRLSVHLIAKLPGATNDDRILATHAYITILVDGMKVKYVPLTVSGFARNPSVLEVGKEYTLESGAPTLFGVADSSGYAFDGVWTLPNGTKVAGNVLKYTPKATDNMLRYDIVSKDDPNVKGYSVYRFTPTQYAWPSFSLNMSVDSNTSPAGVVATLSANTIAGRNLINQFPPKLTWSLPDGMSKSVSNRNVAAGLIYRPGTYNVGVTVEDDRGNISEIASSPIVVNPATLAEFSGSVSVADAYKRAPSDIWVAATPLRFGKNDSIDKFEVYIDGELAVSGAKGPFKSRINSAGSHTVTVKMITKGGAVGSRDYSVDLIAAPTPDCKIEATGTLQTSMTFKANCSLPIGKIVEYRWYADGVIQGTRASQFSLYSFQLSKGLASSYKVIAISDHGEQGSATYNP